MPDLSRVMSNWTCQICGNFVRGRTHPPSYCPKCCIGTFVRAENSSPQPSESDPSGSFMPPLPSTPPSLSFTESELPPLTILPEAPRLHTRCRPAKRIRPNGPLEVRLARTASLEALDISATGLLVEYTRPFPPGTTCEVELWRSSQGIRLRAEVVRSFVSGGGKGSQTGIRYRTAVHFLDTPQTIFTLLPELSESA
jgi:hypothetical protein